MKKFLVALMTLTLLAGCSNTSANVKTFKKHRDNYETVLTREVTGEDEAVAPPDGVGLDLIKFTSEVGDLDAYISANPNDGEKHPLVIWVTGGWGNGIDEFVWGYNSWDNDQSGAFLREKGVLVMYPSFRGGNTNPGFQETLFGEVNDIFSALEYAKTLDYVDSERIYLVGHSTGATRTLLASAYDEGFRSIFSFGPVGDISDHNQDNFTFDLKDKYEAKLRSPIYWLEDIKTPTFIIEGENGNSKQLRQLENADNNDLTEYFIIDGADHFDYLSSATILIADEILKDADDGSGISITSEKLSQAYNAEPTILYPHLVNKQISNTALSIDVPAYWTIETGESYNVFYDSNLYDEYSFWTNTEAMVIFMEITEDDNMEDFYVEYFASLGEDQYYMENINGIDAYVTTYAEEENGEIVYNKTVIFDDGIYLYEVTFYYEGDEFDKAEVLIESMYSSIKIES